MPRKPRPAATAVPAHVAPASTSTPAAAVAQPQQPPPIAYMLHPKQQEAVDLLFVQQVNQMLWGGAAGGGKALPLDTPIVTPGGFTAIGDLRAGDVVMSEHGKPIRVTHAFDPFFAAEAYRLTFDDGTQQVACADHQWLTYTAADLASMSRRTPEFRERRRASRVSRATGGASPALRAMLLERNRSLAVANTRPAPTGGVRTTREIVETLRTHSGRANHAIPVTSPLDFPDADLPVDPYVMGLWLGDGNTGAGRITTMDAEIEAALVAAGYALGPAVTRGRARSFTVYGLAAQLRELGVLGNKHVPARYLRASREQRLALLQGLMDTDGTVTDSGKPEFTNTSKPIIDAVYEIIVSLGWKARIVEGAARLDGRYIGPKWDIKWSPDDVVFRLLRKREKQVMPSRRTTMFRYIVEAEPAEPQMMRCISVDSPSRLYLAGPSMVPTHNSFAQRAAAFLAANVYPGSRVAIFRTHSTQLRKTQIVEFKREMRRLGFDLESSRIWNETNAEFRLYTPFCDEPTVLEFLHLDQAIGAEKWLSAEWSFVGVDESTQMAEEDIKLIYSRIRAPGCTDCDRLAAAAPAGLASGSARYCPLHADASPDARRRYPARVLWRHMADEREAQGAPRYDWVPRMMLTSNPGSISHLYHKADFVDPGLANGLKPWVTREVLEVNGAQIPVEMKRAFVPAFLKDNPSLDIATYAASLANLTKTRREQMLSGNWDFFEGKVFEMLDAEVHLIDARDAFAGRNVPPIEWPRLGGLDHGTTSPTAAIWVTRDEDGFFICGYQEYYAAGPNGQHIDAIRALLMRDGKTDMVFEADPTMYYRKQGHTRLWSVADEFAFGGVPPEDFDPRIFRAHNGINLHQSKAQRVPARMALERLFEPDPNRVFPQWHRLAGQHGAPAAFICQQAPNLWRELNGIQYLEDGSEETVKADDHSYDSLYRALTMFEQALLSQRAHHSRRTIAYAGAR